jgi:hypothetical protein
MALVLGIIVAVFAFVAGMLALVDSAGGKPWHFWIAPLLALGFGAMMVFIAAGYWVKLGRLETKGRPRSD